jgi:hypothetical protein
MKRNAMKKNSPFPILSVMAVAAASLLLISGSEDRAHAGMAGAGGLQAAADQPESAGHPSGMLLHVGQAGSLTADFYGAELLGDVHWFVDSTDVIWLEAQEAPGYRVADVCALSEGVAIVRAQADVMHDGEWSRVAREFLVRVIGKEQIALRLRPGYYE